MDNINATNSTEKVTPTALPSSWIVLNPQIADAASIEAQIEANLANRNSETRLNPLPEELAAQLRIQMLGDPSQISDSSVETLVRRQDYDALPRGYKIDWRFPIIGPIHAIVRRVINDEICRFLFPPLKRQSSLNQQLVDAIQELQEENQLLRTEISMLNRKITTHGSE